MSASRSTSAATSALTADTALPAGAAPMILLGGGGHAAVVADVLRCLRWSIAGCLDDDPEASLSRTDVKHLGPVTSLADVLGSFRRPVTVHAAVGDGRLRRRWLADLAAECDAPPVIHPSAVLSPSTQVGRGVFIGPLAIVNARARIGAGAIINSGAIVEHDAEVGPWSHLAPRSVAAGGARIGEAVTVGCGGIVLPGVAVGDGATIAAGAVAVQDVPDNVTARGVPATW